MYLVRKRFGGKIHLWDGADTKCRMVSTGGLSMRKYVVTKKVDHRLICQMCALKQPDQPTGSSEK